MKVDLQYLKTTCGSVKMFKIIKKGFSGRRNKEAAYMLRLVEIPKGFALTCF